MAILRPTSPSARRFAGLQVGCRGCRDEGYGGACSAHLCNLSQNPNTKEMEEQETPDNGILVLDPAQKQHSGDYQCQSLDLEDMTSLSSETQELLVNCEGLGPRTGGPGWVKMGLALSCPG